VAGDSLRVAPAHGALACEFAAEAGHRYVATLRSSALSGDRRCRIADETAGGAIVAESRGCEPRGFVPCSTRGLLRSQRAYLELVRLLAACSDPVATEVFPLLRGRGRGGRSAADWQLPACDPFYDLR
jgi:hypothetical protein